ncbi:MAG: hypothetical protein ACRDZX_02685 [Acidimicrobiales bacterium]
MAIEPLGTSTQVRGRGRGRGREKLRMFQRTLIAESLRTGTALDDPRLVVSKVTPHAPAERSSDQPTEWTNIAFAVAAADVDVLVDAIAQAGLVRRLAI